MVIDTSALVEIVTKQPGYMRYLDAIEAASLRLISAPTFFETLVVLHFKSKGNSTYLEDLKELFELLHIEVVSFSTSDAFEALAVYQRYGKGVDPAGLNLLDCIAYQLARQQGDPVLFKGDDFSTTDILSAL